MRQLDRETTFCHPSTVVYAWKTQKAIECVCIIQSKRRKWLSEICTPTPLRALPSVVQFIENKLKNFSLGCMAFFHPCVSLPFAFPTSTRYYGSLCMHFTVADCHNDPSGNVQSKNHTIHMGFSSNKDWIRSKILGKSSQLSSQLNHLLHRLIISPGVRFFCVIDRLGKPHWHSLT